MDEIRVSANFKKFQISKQKGQKLQILKKMLILVNFQKITKQQKMKNQQRWRFLMWEKVDLAGKHMWQFWCYLCQGVLDSMTKNGFAFGYHPSGTLYRPPKIMDFVPYVRISN